ncbi:MAG TPA: YezD family protein [Candidatus Acidoferrum sp.]|nr:YezD family protein [Candidatus Acidoferrum sp.]
MKNHDQQLDSDEDRPGWLALVSDQVSSLRFGLVEITVHESRVVHIEKTEKPRFQPNTQLPARNLGA